ncbi:hypothetical protein LAZ67_X002280 [Cordylochernes scorpioides]|uniref:Reverse transcriptase domain-containing protein n=1 Tax=Cordylochernes scorpioides TaxID=51811 RepID=A0ABY6LT85_9ARAC|nr:hypothetical protein LAZ67_X002280 [Cordylochernes scorpioides]
MELGNWIFRVKNSANTEAANHFKESFKNMNDKESYNKSNVYNADETGLYWKKMPTKSLVTKKEMSAPGYKASKSRITAMGLSGRYLPNFGNIHLLLYADDIVLIGDSKINLQLKINILKTYLETNLLTLNENKSRIMVFRNGGKVARSERWYWGQSPLSVTSKYTYQGLPAHSFDFFHSSCLKL